MIKKTNAVTARYSTSTRHGLVRDLRGTAAIEFAIVMFPLIFLIFGAILSGFNLMALAALNAATKDAGRQIQIGAIRGTSDSAVRTLICNRMAIAVSSCNSLVIYAVSGPTFGASQATPAAWTTLPPASFSPGTNGDSVVLQVAYTSPLGLSMTNIGNSVLAATTVFKNEP